MAMSFDNLRYQQGRIASGKAISIPFRTCDVWILENDTEPVLRDVDINTTELSDWLNERSAFAEPQEVEEGIVKGRLRLIYQQWWPDDELVETSKLPMSEHDLDRIIRRLGLPRCYLFDLASRKSVPLRLKRYTSPASLGLVWQSPPIEDYFMTMALNYDQYTNTTCVYLGFETGIEETSPATPGDQLLTSLHLLLNKADHPMLLPAFASAVWVERFQLSNYKSSRSLREIQTAIALMGPYLSKKEHGRKNQLTGIVKQPMNLDDLHEKILLQHAYLTNGVSEFLTDLFPSTTEALQAFKTLRYPHPHQQSNAFRMENEMDDYVEHMRIRANVELQHRDRMLSRMDVYFQVLYNLMQKEVARETKRDSSAMKSISLLTMIFLPATAIATVISPFIDLDADKTRLVMAPQFYVFWAVSAPVTIAVVIAWIMWLQRAEIARFIYVTG
ncbi:hypothetical protein Ptr902_09901 [Pyrenophora tritici-repentis]|nr:hypothetical protein L13192_08689 [Pyrenophora tritici-repentis]KAI2478935.1 hypothetical protein Ptr902_09901 [Pyrenophora tritici-repentis]